MTPEQIEKMIKDYRIGPNSRLIFKNDPQEYWVKNISPNRKEVFLTINGAQTYRKALKNVIKVDNKYVNTIHEMTLDKNKIEFDKNIRKAYGLYQKAASEKDTKNGPILLRKVYDMLDTYEETFNEKYPFEMSIDPEGMNDIPNLNENDDTRPGLRLDKQIRVFAHNFGGPENYKKVQEILSDNGIEFEKKVASFSDKELSNISGLLISTNLAPKAVASSQKYKGTVEVLKNDILKDFPQIKYREFKSLAEIKEKLSKILKNRIKESKSFNRSLILNDSKKFDAPISENLRKHIVNSNKLYVDYNTFSKDLLKEIEYLISENVLVIDVSDKLKKILERKNQATIYKMEGFLTTDTTKKNQAEILSDIRSIEGITIVSSEAISLSSGHNNSSFESSLVIKIDPHPYIGKGGFNKEQIKTIVSEILRVEGVRRFKIKGNISKTTL